MRTLVMGNGGIGLTAGLVGVAVPAAAVVLGAAALAGVFSAAGAVGDFCGGLMYGARRWRMPLGSRLVAAQGGSVGAGVCLALASGTIVGMTLTMPLIGTAGAVQGVTATALLDDVADKGALTGSYAMLVGRGLLGSATGYVAGGILVPAVGVQATFLAAATIGIIVAGWYACRLPTLKARLDQRPTWCP
jgi:MFS family permease